MPSGPTIVDSVREAEPYMLAAGRVVNEHEPMVPNLCDRVRLKENTGRTWYELDWRRIEAMDVDVETESFDRIEQLSAGRIGIEPTRVAVGIMLSPDTIQRWDTEALMSMIEIPQRAMNRKQDKDGLAQGELAERDVGGSSTLTAGKISAAVANPLGEPSEGSSEVSMDDLRGIFDPWSFYAIDQELVKGLTATGAEQLMTPGLSQMSYQRRYRGNIYGADMYIDGNFERDGSDAHNFVFSQKAIILVQGVSPMVNYEELKGRAGAVHVRYWDQYAYGERSVGHWLVEVTATASRPT